MSANLSGCRFVTTTGTLHLGMKTRERSIISLIYINTIVVVSVWLSSVSILSRQFEIINIIDPTKMFLAVECYGFLASPRFAENSWKRNWVSWPKIRSVNIYFDESSANKASRNFLLPSSSISVLSLRENRMERKPGPIAKLA